MKILVTGAGGMIGSALVPWLQKHGHGIVRLVRREPSAGEISWDPEGGTIQAEKLEGLDAVVHLAGKPLMSGRWTRKRKASFRMSRVAGTHLLSVALARLDNPPEVFVSASAIGYYGNCGNEILREDSKPGRDYLALLCRDWEAAAQPAAEVGIRLVRIRTGVVMSPDGGALAKMLPVFRAGLGGPLGSGRQYMSWISLDDTVGAITHVLNDETLQGPVNVVSPNPVTNKEFAKALGRALGRPAILPAPAFALRFAFGEMADAALLSSARAQPARLIGSGYEFQHPELEPALRQLLSE